MERLGVGAPERGAEAEPEHDVAGEYRAPRAPQVLARPAPRAVRVAHATGAPVDPRARALGAAEPHPVAGIREHLLRLVESREQDVERARPGRS